MSRRSLGENYSKNKVGYHNIQGYNIYCELSGNARPMVPKELREVIMQTFYALGHPNGKETTRREERQISSLLHSTVCGTVVLLL